MDELTGEKRFCSQFCADKDAEVIRKREERKREARLELKTNSKIIKNVFDTILIFFTIIF